MRDEALRILWVKSGPLHPLDTGGKIRTYNMLKELRKRHRITFLSLEAPSAPEGWRERSKEYCHEVIAIPWKEYQRASGAFYFDLARNLLFTGIPYAIDKYSSPGMARAIAGSDDGSFDLMVCDFLAPAVNFPAAGTPTILFEHNVESDIWRRHYEQRRRNTLSGWYFRIQWERMLEFERTSCKRFGGVVTVSPKDSQTLRAELGAENVIGDVPAGVDLDYFRPGRDGDKRHSRLVFTGSMDWMPNDDAVCYFIREIYPRIRASVPDVTFTVAGRRPSQGLRDLASGDPSIRVTGTVEDIRPYVHEAEAMVIPLRIGGGTRIKIFEGMAMGIPIVSTAVGSEGLPVTNGTDIILANDPGTFAHETVRLMRDPDLRKRIADSALRMVREAYSWEAVCRVFESYCYQAVSGATGRSVRE